MSKVPLYAAGARNEFALLSLESGVESSGLKV
jgi:hypothetical protein